MKKIKRKNITVGLEFVFLGTTYRIVKVRPLKKTAVVVNPENGFKGEYPLRNIIKRGVVA